MYLLTTAFKYIIVLSGSSEDQSRSGKLEMVHDLASEVYIHKCENGRFVDVCQHAENGPDQQHSILSIADCPVQPSLCTVNADVHGCSVQQMNPESTNNEVICSDVNTECKVVCETLHSQLLDVELSQGHYELTDTQESLVQKKVVSFSHVDDDNSLIVTSITNKPKQSLLLRLFESKLFSMSIAIQYLFNSKEPGVLSYLGKFL